MTHLLTMTCGMAIGCALTLSYVAPQPRNPAAQKPERKIERISHLAVRDNKPRPSVRFEDQPKHIRAASF